MKNYSVRTDLALEEKERFASDNVEVQGVVLEEEYDEENEIRLTRVVIETENGAKIMGKPTGIYLTLESPDLALDVEENSRVFHIFHILLPYGGLLPDDLQHKGQAHPVLPPCYQVRQKESLILFHLHRRFYERSIPGCNRRSAPAIPGYFPPHPMPDSEIPVSDKYLSVFP